MEVQKSRSSKLLITFSGNSSNFGCDFFFDPYPKSIHGQGKFFVDTSPHDPTEELTKESKYVEICENREACVMRLWKIWPSDMGQNPPPFHASQLWRRRRTTVFHLRSLGTTCPLGRSIEATQNTHFFEDLNFGIY